MSSLHEGVAKKDPKEAWSKYICWNCDELGLFGSDMSFRNI